jgi:hypothetical protein
MQNWPIVAASINPAKFYKAGDQLCLTRT